jgi:uroporphyrinogen-III synthase
MRFLVTRAPDTAAAFAEALRERGHEAVIAPLFRVRFICGAPLDLDGFSAIVFTSANGVAALAQRCAVRDLPVFAVGPQTAGAARAAGFTLVRGADGDRRDLAALIARGIPPGSRLLHAAGMDGYDVPVEGYDVCRIPLYDMEAAAQLPEEACRALRAGTLSGSFFFSPRGAAVFCALALRDGLDGFCVGLDAYCISAATANFLSRLRFAHFYIAHRPNRAALLNMLPILPSDIKAQ